MRKFTCLLFVLKRSYIFCYIICTTVPLKIKKESPERCEPPNEIIKILHMATDTRKALKKGKMKSEKYRKSFTT